MTQQAPAIPRFDPASVSTGERLTVGELCDRYLALAREYYIHHDGRSQAHNIAPTLRVLREAAGELMAPDLDYR